MFYNPCPNCFGERVNNLGVCADCGYDQSRATKFEGVIEPNEILNARYLVGRVLGKGGFGVTYLAKDLLTEKKVAIKECLPEANVYRADDGNIYQKPDNTIAFNHCKSNFIDEINALQVLRDNPFVVDEYDSFAERNTEFFVMEYIDGVTVKKITYSNGGKMSIQSAAQVLFTVGSALMEVHRHGIIHRDISPENIMFCLDERILLIDFGAAKNFAGDSSENISILFKPGFAPPEQYEADGNQGPWTDVYALAATFYTIVSGQPLPPSPSRLDGGDTMKSLFALGIDIDPAVSDAVSKALEPNIEDRYHSIEEFFRDVSPLMLDINNVDGATMSVVESEKNRQNIFGESDRVEGVRNPYIEVVAGRRRGARVKIPESTFIPVGREANSCKLVVDDYYEVSRIHCYVGYDRVNNRFIVIDNSSNGTYFSNFNRMLPGAESYLHEGDEFLIYNNDLRIKVELV